MGQLPQLWNLLLILYKQKTKKVWAHNCNKSDKIFRMYKWIFFTILPSVSRLKQIKFSYFFIHRSFMINFSTVFLSIRGDSGDVIIRYSDQNFAFISHVSYTGLGSSSSFLSYLQFYSLNISFTIV
jgi:hypothetical protein